VYFTASKRRTLATDQMSASRDPIDLDPSENGLVAIIGIHGKPAAKVKSTVGAAAVCGFEAYVCLLEFLICKLMTGVIRQLCHSSIARVGWGPLQMTLLRFFGPKSWAAALLEGALVFCYMVHRYSRFFHFNFQAFFFHFFGSCRFSRSTIGLIFYQGLSLCGLFMWQLHSKTIFVSFEAAYTPDEGLQLERLLQWLCVSPILEELVFRVLVFHILYNRYPHVKPCVAVTSVLFGLLHLQTLLRPGGFDHVPYVLLQVCLGTLAGAFLGVRFLLATVSARNPLRTSRGGAAWTSIVLHATQNACAVAWLPRLLTETETHGRSEGETDSGAVSGRAFLFLAMAHTVSFYCIGIIWSWSELRNAVSAAHCDAASSRDEMLSPSHAHRD